MNFYYIPYEYIVFSLCGMNLDYMPGAPKKSNESKTKASTNGSSTRNHANVGAPARHIKFSTHVQNNT